MNLLLMRKGFPPAIILKNEPKEILMKHSIKPIRAINQKLILLMSQALEKNFEYLHQFITGQ